MSVTIGQFVRIDFGRIDLGELNLLFRSDSDKFDPSSQGEFFKSTCKPIVNDDSISVEGCSGNTGVKLSPAFFHGSNEINNRIHISELELIEHVSDREIFFVDVVNFDKFGKFTAWEKKIVWFPKFLLASF
jgi:hypothetical protein